MGVSCRTVEIPFAGVAASATEDLLRLGGMLGVFLGVEIIC
jgi:hypothetical protein